jgi:hypothetical protein
MVVGDAMDQIFMVMDYYQLDLSACLKSKRQPCSTSEVPTDSKIDCISS